MPRIAVAAALIVSVLAFAKSERLLDRTGLLGSCSELAAPAPNGGRWLECTPGDLNGYPDLSRNACARRGMRGETRYWICPSPLVAAYAPRESG